jgi:hypothetical protein
MRYRKLEPTERGREGMGQKVETREAAHGMRMIEVRVRFWTNDLAEGKGRIRPKHAWGAGVVRLEPNDAHGVSSASPVPFNTMSEISGKIEKVLIDNGISIHPSDRMRKYMS